MEAFRTVKSTPWILGLFLAILVSVPAEPAADQNAEIIAKLPSVVGRIVYATGFSRLYEASATLEEMQQPLTIKRYLTGWQALDDFCRDRLCLARRIPLLDPMRITAVYYIPEHKAFVLNLKTQKGRDVISLTTAEMVSEPAHNGDLLYQISGLLLPEMPRDLSATEISAIQKRELFHGMSEMAIIDMLGFPVTDSEWGSGRQLFYSDSLVIYLNEKHKMVKMTSPGFASLRYFCLENPFSPPEQNLWVDSGSGLVSPEMGEGFFQLPGSGCGQLAGQQSVEFLPGSPQHVTNPALLVSSLGWHCAWSGQNHQQ